MSWGNHYPQQNGGQQAYQQGYSSYSQSQNYGSSQYQQQSHVQQQSSSSRSSEWANLAPSYRQRKKKKDEEERRRRKREEEKRRRKEKEKQKHKQKHKHKRKSSSSVPEPVQTKKKSEFLCTTKYRTRLHGPPIGPKLIQFDFSPNRLTRYCSARLELAHKWQFHEDADLGIPIDLIDPNAYRSSVTGLWKINDSERMRLKQDGSNVVLLEEHIDKETDHGFIKGNQIYLHNVESLGTMSESGFEIKWKDDSVWTKEASNLDEADRLLLEDQPSKRSRPAGPKLAPFLRTSRLVTGYGDEASLTQGRQFNKPKTQTQRTEMVHEEEHEQQVRDEFEYVNQFRTGTKHAKKDHVTVVSSKPVYLSSLKDNSYTLVQFTQNPAKMVKKKDYVQNKIEYPDPVDEQDPETAPSAWNFAQKSILKAHKTWDKTCHIMFVPTELKGGSEEHSAEFMSDFDQHAPPKKVLNKNRYFIMESNRTVEIATLKNKLGIRKRNRERHGDASRDKAINDKYDTMPRNIDVVFGGHNDDVEMQDLDHDNNSDVGNDDDDDLDDENEI